MRKLVATLMAVGALMLSGAIAHAANQPPPPAGPAGPRTEVPQFRPESTGTLELPALRLDNGRQTVDSAAAALVP